MSLKEKLRKWMDERWNYEIQCDIFEGLDKEELSKIAKIYNLDSSMSRLEVCKELSKILDSKKEQYKDILDESSCNNSMDPISGTNVEDIDSRELVTISQDGKTYCFEIEGLYKNVFVTKNHKNPYTNVPFDQDTLSTIEAEYEKFKLLKGKKFDKYEYSSDTSLTAIANQLLSYLPYTGNVDKFIKADEAKINYFIIVLSAYGVDFDTSGIDKSISIGDIEDTLLEQHKIYIARQLIKWILKNDYINVREAWIDTFQNINEDLISTVMEGRDMQRLVNEGADINIMSYDKTLLQVSIITENKNYDNIRYLIDNITDIDYQDNLGNTALVYAVIYNDYRTVKMLLKAGSNYDLENADGMSALEISSLEGVNEEIRNELIGLISDSYYTWADS